MDLLCLLDKKLILVIMEEIPSMLASAFPSPMEVRKNGKGGMTQMMVTTISI